MDLTNTIARAHGVALAFLELANDAINQGWLPKNMATVMSGTANQMALELGRQLVKAGSEISPYRAKKLKNVCTDLEALGDLAGLVAQFHFTEKNTMQLALVLGYTAERTADILSRLEDAH